ncbi:hypothetical protein IV02_10205 [Pseudomonas syringae]|uniref:Uncharacterized protein n=2 Tax=Pseudomonas syringae TaxID=317 RepID=A0A085V9K7_PSESX|nr:hypothetical protein IV02_10205 [Pseudomonas syringae]
MLILETLHQNPLAACEDKDKGLSDCHRFSLRSLTHVVTNYFRLLPNVDEFLSMSSQREEAVPILDDEIAGLCQRHHPFAINSEFKQQSASTFCPIMEAYSPSFDAVGDE